MITVELLQRGKMISVSSTPRLGLFVPLGEGEGEGAKRRDKKERRSGSPCSLTPHPNPLPEGEGDWKRRIGSLTTYKPFAQGRVAALTFH